MKCRIIEHDAIATPILEVRPLTIRERIQPPTTGVVLVLEDGKHIKFIPEGRKVPQEFDLLIRDEAFGTAFTVTPKEFATRFAIEEETRP